MKVVPIPNIRAYPLILTQHYALRKCSIISAYGLILNSKLIGVVAYGAGANKSLQENCPWGIWELVRLVLIPDSPDNSASFLIAGSLKLLPKPKLVISYADTQWGHVGYVYQATNWIYTGLSGTCDQYYINDRLLASKTVSDKYGTRSIPKLRELGLKVKYEKLLPKHRYFKLLAISKKQKKSMYEYIKERFGIFSYPKGPTKKWDVKELYSEKHKNRGGFFKL